MVVPESVSQVSRAPFWSILQTIFTSLGSLEVLILSSIDKPAVCLREWENPGPSEEPLFTRPVHCSLLKPCGTWWVTDLSQASGLPLHSPSCASQISFFVHVTLLLWFSWFLSLRQCSFLLLQFVFLSFFFFFPLLCHAVSHFEQRPIKKNKREELNNSKMSCYTINLLCCGEWWKDAFLESYCLLEFELCHFLCNCGASYFSSKLMSPCPPPVYKTGYSIIIVPSLQCCEFSVI